MAALERESPTSANWSHEHFESLFKTTTPAPSNYFVFVAEDPLASIVAYLAAHQVDDDWELQYVVVAKEYRRRGVGTWLLKELIAHARATAGSRIFLEVRESNQNARVLYSRLGFQQQGSRKSYYSNPTEDAILYRLKL